jgi:membrane protease YdiL (CAAX protease family)
VTDFLGLFASDLVASLGILALVSPLWFWESRRGGAPSAGAAGRLAGLFVVYTLLTHAIGFSVQRSAGLDGLRFNWAGKLIALAFGLLVVSRHASGQRRALGWTGSLAPGTLRFALLVTTVAVAIRAALALVSEPGRPGPSMEEFLYQLTLPGLAEETWHRGLFLPLINRVFPRRFRCLGTPFGVGLILTSVAFGLEHGLSVAPGTWGVTFSAFSFARTALTGFLVYGLLRERTESVLPSIVAHNLSNVSGPVVDLLRR